MLTWNETSLGDACELYQPKTLTTADLLDDGEYLVYGANGVIGRYDKYNHEDAEILITCRGATCGTVNVSEPKSWVNGNAMVVKPRNGELDFSFLQHLLRGGIDLSVAITGAAQPQITRQSLAPIRFKYPPLPEQRRIAAILDKADALRALRREALVHLDRLAQSIFLEMFGDPISNSKSWPVLPIASLGDVITGNTPPRANPANYGDAIEWIKSDNLNNPNYFATPAEEGLSELGRLRARTAPPLSILVTCIAGSPDCIGNAAMIDREVAFNQQINAFVPTFGNPHFFYALFRVGKRLIQEASTGGMKGLVSKGRFERIEVIVPPHELQNKFAEIVMATERQMEAQRKSLGELDTLFASLQYQAFHGALSA